jgi:hypothetical protein
MTSEQFCYWLQGYFELKQTIDHRDGATPETMKVIEEHLQTVFEKVTPPTVQRWRRPVDSDLDAGAGFRLLQSHLDVQQSTVTC